MTAAIVAVTLATGLATTALAQESPERPCTTTDLVGTWILDSGKNQGEQVPDSLQGLMKPLQVRVYGEGGDYRELSANKALTPEQIQNLLSVSQGQTYELKGDLVLTRRIADGVVLDGYQCRYYSKPLASANILPGTLSLLWAHKNVPVVLNTYVKYQLGAPLLLLEPNDAAGQQGHESDAE